VESAVSAVSLSATVVVEDAAGALDACLTSLRGLVDEIVVVDTGSTDRSVQVAEQHGAVVAQERWDGDCSAARNRSLDLATGDWILAVDATEQVRGDVGAARALLAEAGGSVAFRVPYVPRAGWTPSLEYRLWRNRPDLRFAGHLHETIVPAIDAVAAAERLRTEPFHRLTIHRGAGVRTNDARARITPLLVAELARDPYQPFVYDHLARIYEAGNDGQLAVDTWRAGIARVRQHERGESDARRLYIGLIHHLLEQGVVDDELESLVDEARARFERTPSLELAAARLAFATGRPRDALEPLDWLLSLDDDAIIATGASYDERVFGEWAWGLLGLCRFALGDDAAAADAFGRAEELAPDEPSYGVRRRLAEARAATPTS
jgi:tetratricopeptide (TPR) repeat protein